jgi:hypothetical protein
MFGEKTTSKSTTKRKKNALSFLALLSKALEQR